MATKDPNQPNAPGEYYLLKTNSKGDLGNVDTDNSVKEFFEDRDIGVIQSTALLQSLNTVEFKSPTTTPNTLYVDGDAGTGWPGLKAGTLNIATSKPSTNNLTVNWSVDSSDLHQTEKNFAAAILREGVDKNGNVVADWKTSLYFAHPFLKFLKVYWIQKLPQELKNLLGGCVQDIVTSSTVQGFFEDIENGINSYVELSSGGKDTTLSDKNAENIIDAINRLYSTNKDTSKQIANNPKGVKSFEQLNLQYDVLEGNINSIIGPVFSSSIFNDFIDYTDTNNLISGVTQNYTLIKKVEEDIQVLEITGLFNAPKTYESGKYLVSLESGVEWQSLDLGSNDFTGFADTPNTYSAGKYLISTESGIEYITPITNTLTSNYEAEFLIPKNPTNDGEIVNVSGNLYVSNTGEWKVVSQTDKTKISESAQIALPESVTNTSELIQYNKYVDEVMKTHMKSSFISGLHGGNQDQFFSVSVSPKILNGNNIELHQGENKTYIQETNQKWGIFNDQPTVNIVAEPDQYCTFSHWQGSAVTDINSPTTTILVDSNISITGCFNCSFPSYIKLDANSSPIPYQIQSTSLGSQGDLSFKIDGNPGNFTKIEDTDTNTVFTLTIGGIDPNLTVTINDGINDISTLSLNDSIEYTLSSGAIITFNYAAVGSVILNVSQKSGATPTPTPTPTLTPTSGNTNPVASPTPTPSAGNTNPSVSPTPTPTSGNISPSASPTPTPTLTATPTPTPSIANINKSEFSLDGGSDINVSINSGNYVFNNQSSNDNLFTINKGTHYFKNIPESHPIGFFAEVGSINFRYGGSKWAGSKNNSAGNEIHYFWGDIVMEIFENFSSLSYDCIHHGYMGGKNNLKFDSNVAIFNKPKWSIDYDESQYTDDNLSAQDKADIQTTLEFIESFVISNLNGIETYELSLVNPSSMKKKSAVGGVLASAGWTGGSKSKLLNGSTFTPYRGQMQVDPYDAPILRSHVPRPDKSGLFFVVLHELGHALGIGTSSYGIRIDGKKYNEFISITRQGGVQYTGYNGVQAYNKITGLNVSSLPLHTTEKVGTFNGFHPLGKNFTVTSEPITNEDLQKGYIVHNNRWRSGSNSKKSIPSGLNVGDTFDYGIFVYGQGHTAEFPSDSPINIDNQNQVVLCDTLMSPNIAAPYFADFDELTLGMLTDLGWYLDFSKKIV